MVAVSDLEGMINGILSNPDEMKKIMDMAGKIMNSEGAATTSQATASGSQSAPSLDSILNGINANPEGLAKMAENLLGNGGLQSLLGGGGLQSLLGGGNGGGLQSLLGSAGLQGLLGGGAQKLLGSPTIQKLIGSPAVQSLVSGGFNTKNDKRELFNALKPYLSEERRFKLEKAIVFARVMRYAGVAGAAGVAAFKK